MIAKLTRVKTSGAERTTPQSYAWLIISTDNTHMQIALNYECSCMIVVWCDDKRRMCSRHAKTLPGSVTHVTVWLLQRPQRQSHALHLIVY